MNKVKTIKINDYNHLVENLKKFGISPQETWDLVEKTKIQLNKKTRWKLEKYFHYLMIRINELGEVYKKNKFDPKINELKGIKHFEKIKKYLPKRVDSIRKLVNMPLYFHGFNYFEHGKKFDKRKEVKNLEKLIIDKRQDYWWNPVWFDMVSETYKSKNRISFALPGYKDLVKILR